MAKEPKPFKPAAPSSRRTFRPLRADSVREPSSSALLRDRGFFTPGVIGDWPHIVGKELAACSSPLRMITRPVPGGGSTVTLYVALFRAPMAMALQMAEPVILERLATYSGHRRADKLVIKHFFSAPERRSHNIRAKRVQNPILLQHATDAINGIDDNILAERLAKLAQTLYQDR